MAAPKRKRGGRPAKYRSSWRGLMTFGLVSFPVEAFNALDRSGSDVHFHQLHAKCHNRIRYRKECPVHGVVSTQEIVSGFEAKKGKYIEIDPKELDALRTKSERALTIDAFVSSETVDPLYFDGRMYFLMPGGAAAREPYAVIVEAMEREERCGVGQLVMSGKDQIVLVRPLDGVLHMAMLNYPAEIRSPKTMARAVKASKNVSRQVRLAQTLIEEWSQDNFDFSRYEDLYRERVRELIRRKSRGEVVEPEEEAEDTGEVLNLMDALKRSLGQVSRHGRSKGSRPIRSA